MSIPGYRKVIRALRKRTEMENRISTIERLKEDTEKEG